MRGEHFLDTMKEYLTNRFIPACAGNTIERGVVF